MPVAEGAEVWATGVLVASGGRHGLLLEHATRGLDQVPPTLDAPWVVALTGFRPVRDALCAVLEVVGLWTGDEIRVAHVTILGHRRDRSAPGEAAEVDGPTDSAARAVAARSTIRRPPPRLAASTSDVLRTLDTLGLVVTHHAVPGSGSCAEDEGVGGATVRVTVTDVDAAVRVVGHVGDLGRAGDDRILLVPSRRSALEVAAARDLHAQVPEALLVAFGESVTEDDQLQVQLTVTYVTPALEGLVARLPVGIVDVTALVQQRSSPAHRV